MLPEQEARAIETYIAGHVPNVSQQKRRGCLSNLFRAALGLIFGGAVLYVVVVITAPWSLHIGERWTPFLTWQGYGRLVTKGGLQYPLYVSLYPASHFSELHRDGLRPTGGVQGSGWLCTSSGAVQRLTFSGTMYGGWRSTNGSLMAIRLLQSRIIKGQARGFFDLTGKWQGSKLVMDEREDVPETFRSGLRIERASVTLNWGTYSQFKELCATTGAGAPGK